MGGLLQPGPTLAQAEELRKQKGSRGLLAAVGEPLSYAPIPGVAMLGQGLLGAQYLTGEKPLNDRLASLSDMTAFAVGSMLPPGLRQGALMAAKIHKDTGLPLNDDGTVTLYHGTTKDGAKAIKKSGLLKSAGEPDVYLTTSKAGTGYGDGSVVAVRVNPSLLKLDDEFPGGRKDFAVSVGKPGGSLRVKVD